jgi:hypothetical protein
VCVCAVFGVLAGWFGGLPVLGRVNCFWCQSFSGGVFFQDLVVLEHAPFFVSRFLDAAARFVCDHLGLVGPFGGGSLLVCGGWSCDLLGLVGVLRPGVRVPTWDWWECCGPLFVFPIGGSAAARFSRDLLGLVGVWRWFFAGG